MTDIRRRVEEDRGLLKKIQLVVPGFAGYRRKEDIRTADAILRKQLADRLVDIRNHLEDCRRSLVENMMTQHLEKMGSLVNKVRAVEGEVRHAEQGYSGISWAIRIKEDELNRLYEYDYSMLTYINDISATIPSLQNAIDMEDDAQIKSQMNIVRSKLDAFRDTFKMRMNRITGVEVY